MPPHGRRVAPSIRRGLLLTVRNRKMLPPGGRRAVEKRCIERWMLADGWELCAVVSWWGEQGAEGVGVMDGQLLTYAIVKALYDRRRDYIETFEPFVLSVLDTTVAVELHDAAGKVSSTRSIAMPMHVVERILRRAMTEGLVETLQIHKGAIGYRLTQKGERYCCALEDEEHAERRVSELLEAICDFATREGAEGYTTERARNELLSLINENLETFARYVNPRIVDDARLDATGDSIVVLRYIEHAKASLPSHYSTVRDMVFGSVITAILSTPDAAALNEIERPLSGTIAYLDSNVIFSLLGLQGQHLVSAAQELVGLMRAEGIGLRTFGFILDEARNVLVRYARNQGPLPGSHNPESVYVQLRVKGVSSSDALELSGRLVDELLEKGVRLESSTGFDLGTYAPNSQELLDALVRAKAAGRQQPDLAAIERAARVDMAAIETVLTKRGGRVGKIEDARYVFLTRDRRLANFNREDMGHRTSGTVPEVLLDSVFTNLLWLKNPQLSVSLESVIAAHSDDLLKYDALWVRFSEIIAKLRSENRIDSADASALLTEESIMAIMEERPDLDIDEVDEEMVVEEAQRFSREYEGRLAALEKAARENEDRANAADRERVEASARESSEVNRLSGTLDSRDASIRHLVERQARGQAFVRVSLVVVPIALLVWGASLWLMTRFTVPTVLFAILAVLSLFVSSGLAWLVLQHFAEQKRAEIEFDLLKKHGLG